MTSKNWEIEINEDELDRQIERAQAAWVKAASTEPRAQCAEYNRRHKLIIVKLINGAEFRCPPHLIEGLDGASSANLAEVHLSGDGSSIHWEKLDVDLSIPGLVTGIFGSKDWMSELGKRGGKQSSPTKAAAARENGKKGGRPRKAAITV